MIYYRVVKDSTGHQRLEAVEFEEFSDEVLERMNLVIEDFTAFDDSSVLSRIAAGTAAKRIFAHKFYRKLGLTKEKFCTLHFDRSPRTIASYIAAADSYEDIGGTSCAVQPDSVYQLDVLGRIRPTLRKRLWLSLAKNNEGRPPSGDALEAQARIEKAFIKKAVKSRKPEQPDLPCTTREEAIAFATAYAEYAPSMAGAWRAMERFLRSLQAKSSTAPAKGKNRVGKPKPVKDVRGQTLMFDETLTLKDHGYAPDIPKLG
jgi:hypothetical protein